MANRSWNNHSQDWDPMREDFNNTTYDAQYPDDNAGGGVQLDQCRLYITNIPKTLTEDGLRTVFSKYGTLVESFLSRDSQKRYALVSYETPGEAKLALMKLNRTEPLNLNVYIAHKKKTDRKAKERKEWTYTQDSRDDTASQSSRGLNNNRKQDDCQLTINGDEENDNLVMEYEEFGDNLDPELHMELVQLKMEHLKLQEAQLQCKQRMLLLNNRVTKNSTPLSGNNRCILPDGRIVVKNVNDRPSELGSESCADGDANYGQDRSTVSWDPSGGGSNRCSSTITFIQCEDQVNWHCSVTGSYPSRESSKEAEIETKESQMTSYDLALRDFNNDEVNEETDRLILSRATDYKSQVEDHLKLVIAPDGYPKLEMQLRQMEMFQRAIDGIVEMQVKAGLLKKSPSFHDCYLNRGAIVCIFKDIETRDWFVRVFAGLEERMGGPHMLLTTKLKRICVGTLKIPKGFWPSTARDVFKQLQYFNPQLRTDSWRIYYNKSVNKVKCMCFLVDRISAEIIRGSKFKNAIDYNSIDFELSDQGEVYYESVCSELRDGISSIASRIKLLSEIKSQTSSDTNMTCLEKKVDIPQLMDTVKRTLKGSYNQSFVEFKGDEYVSNDPGDNQIVLPSSEVHTHDRDKYIDNSITRDRADSVMESLVDSTVTVDSRQGVAYHRRTNYLYVDNELKLAITLNDYPQGKLEGTHIKRLRKLFTEQLHKDVKSGRLQNRILPRFYDVFLSNGAVVYVCDSLETRDYLTEILPKFISSTGLKLVFKEIDQLVRYTRVVMRLPVDLSHLESKIIMKKLQETYPLLKPDCWKFYSDVVGKQKRQFGVVPESLKVIRRPDFEFSYEGKEVTFKIICRKKPDIRISQMETKYSQVEEKELWQSISKEMYRPIDADITVTSLSRMRANHYSDFVADDLKLYVGPTNYPETRLEQAVFYKIKDVLKSIVLESVRSGREEIPKFYDLYLFDGVVFAICCDSTTKQWIEDHIPVVGSKLGLKLRSTEYRGAVGIVSMIVRTTLQTDEVIAILQNQNPRLRTKFWRKISEVRSQMKLDVVLQIDKLSAQMINDPEFQRLVRDEPVQFKLGHLLSMIRPKTSLAHTRHTGQKEKGKTVQLSVNQSVMTMGSNQNEGNERFEYDDDYSRMILEVSTHILPDIKDDLSLILDQQSLIRPKTSLACTKHTEQQKKSQSTAQLSVYQSVMTMGSYQNEMNGLNGANERFEYDDDYSRMTLEVPKEILPDSKDDFNVILDLLEDKNPGLNTELWKFSCEDYYSFGRFTLLVDKQSASVIKGKGFDSTIAGEQLNFIF